MPYFYSSNIIPHIFCVNENQCDIVIVYEIIIGRDLMVKLSLIANFKRKVLEWDNNIVTTKDTGNLLGKPNIAGINMREVAMNTTEPVYTREYTDAVVDILYNNF